MTWRQAALKVHLWTSLGFSAVIVIVCLTGSALVYRHDIDRALNPSLYRTTSGDVGWDAVWRSVGTKYSLSEGALVRGPVDRGVYQVEIGDRLLPFTVHVDPGTGQILGAREPAQSLSGWLFLLHFNLFAGEFGHQLIGVTGIALLLLTLTGAWLWWPTLRRWAFGFRIRWARPFFVVNYDLHRVIGIWSLPLVLVLALTGAILVFYEVGGRLVYALFFTTQEAAAPRPPLGALKSFPVSVPATLNDAAALAVRIAPEAAASSMYVPADTTEPVRVWLRTPGDTRPNVGSWHVEVDRTTGAVVSAMLPGNTSLAAHVEETWVIALHYGTFGGKAVRALYALAGLVPVVLLITGVVHWLLRRRARSPVPSLLAD